jgi:hypothetical protein
MNLSGDNETKRENSWNWLIVSQLVSIIPWFILFLAAIFSTFLLIEISSDDLYSPPSLLQIFMLWFGVLFPAFSAVLAWRLYNQGAEKKAVVWSSFVLLPIFYLLIPLLIM